MHSQTLARSTGADIHMDPGSLQVTVPHSSLKSTQVKNASFPR
jgi:hypothetical protein